MTTPPFVTQLAATEPLNLSLVESAVPSLVIGTGGTPGAVTSVDGQTGNVSTMTALQATTGVAGFALQNATPSILSWTAPNDGKMHRVQIFADQIVSGGPGVGGTVTLGFNSPDGVARTQSIFPANPANGYHGINSGAALACLVQAGSTVTVSQTAALSTGTSTVWIELWAS